MTSKEDKVSLIDNKKSPWTTQQIGLITRTVAKGADRDELGLFLYTAKKTGLDPLTKQIHFIKFQTKDGPQIAIVTGIGGYLSIAERTGEYAGMDDVVFDDNATYEAGKEPKNPSKATCKVYRIVKGQRVDFTATVRWKEYYPTNARNQFKWNQSPYSQLAKCARALALRLAFPLNLSGIHVEEEFDKQLSQAEVAVESKKITSKVEKENAVSEVYRCIGCDIEVPKNVADYSKQMYEVVLCREDQKNPDYHKK